MMMMMLFLLSMTGAAALGDDCRGVPLAVDGAPRKNRFVTEGGQFKCPTYADKVPLSQCLGFQEEAGTRCCSDTEATSVCTNSVCELVTFEESRSRCAALGEGWRLCTETEILEDNRGEGTGCGFDHAPVWTFPKSLNILGASVMADDTLVDTLEVEVANFFYKSTSGVHFTALPSTALDVVAQEGTDVVSVYFELRDGDSVYSGVDGSAPFRLKDAVGVMDFNTDAKSATYELKIQGFSASGLAGDLKTFNIVVADRPFNPVTQEILLEDSKGTNTLKLQLLASMPADAESDPRGVLLSRRLRINCMIPGFNDDIYVCMESLGIIRRVDVATGDVTTWFDVYDAIEKAVNRTMNNLGTFPHSGLRGLAFHENFAENGLFYTSLLETRPSDTTGLSYLGENFADAIADSVVVEWKFSDGLVDPSSYRQLFRVAMPTFPEQERAYDSPVKQISMRDGLLYISMGDGRVPEIDNQGGRSNDAFGKVLRIKPDGASDYDYSIPTDNPFIGDDRYPDEVYAVGFRNPHHISFTKSGDAFVADVGRDNAEEINYLMKGADYGWNEREGTFVHVSGGGGLVRGVVPLPANDADFGYTYPAAQFGHEGGVIGAEFQDEISHAIAGGFSVENEGSELNGRYFYGDFPEQGPIYYSYLEDLRSATLTGNDLTQASSYLAQLELYDSNDELVLKTIHFRDVVKYGAAQKGLSEPTRNDMRFGLTPNGALLISSKRDGNIYKVVNSLASEGSARLDVETVEVIDLSVSNNPKKFSDLSPGSIFYKKTNGINFQPLPESGQLDLNVRVPGFDAEKVKFELKNLDSNEIKSGIDSEFPWTLSAAINENFKADAAAYELTVTAISKSGVEGTSQKLSFFIVDEPFDPVTKPVAFEDPKGNVMKLKLLASMPSDAASDPRGVFTSRRLRINCMVPGFDNDVYVCMESLGLIRKFDVATGEITTWFDVYAAIEETTSRQMDNLGTFPHSGLRGLAFHENYFENGLFYTSLLETHPTDTTGLTYVGDNIADAIADSVVIEWKVVDGQVDAASYRQLFRVAMPTFPEEDVAYESPIKQISMHKGDLYVSMGDGYVEDQDFQGGRGNNFFGKVLRIKPDGASDYDYSIPSDNPFIGDDRYPDEVFALGFRSPHTICFTKDGHGIVSDIGRDNAEEVNMLKKGADYGWNEREGTFVHVTDGGGLLLGVGLDLPQDDALNGFTYPAAQFGHEGGQRGAGFQDTLSQSIAGGFPVENAGADLDGRFFYGDFPEQGPIYYSYLEDLQNAVTTGSNLTQATSYLAHIELYDADDQLLLETIHFRDVVNYGADQKGLGPQSRNDMRFGVTPDGALLISSKRDGNIYVVTNSLAA